MEYRFGRGRSAPRGCYPSGRGARVWFNPLPHPDNRLRNRTQPRAASQVSPGGPGADLRTGGGFGLPPMDRFTSPALALSRPARTVVRPVAPLNRPHRAFGRQLDALPSRWSEEKSTAGLSASDRRARSIFRTLIGLRFVRRSPGMEDGRSPGLAPGVLVIAGGVRAGGSPALAATNPVIPGLVPGTQGSAAPPSITPAPTVWRRDGSRGQVPG